MTQEAAKRGAAAIDQARLWRRHMAMAEIGKIPGGGVSRQALSGDDIRARALLLEWAGARGYRPAVDDIANLFIRRPGRDPDAAPVVAGSHMDSQPAGGRFDGIFGVLAGLEALEALDDAGIATERPIDVVAWTNEEGGRFAPGAMGSAVFAGHMRLEDCLGLTDAAGIRLADALAETLAATPEVPRRPFAFPIAAYLEPHIEQGPQLEATGNQIGVVTGIQGARWYVVEVEGEPGHAGTAPLRGRKDAVRAAVAIIAALQELMHDATDVLRFTVGRIEVFPELAQHRPGAGSPSASTSGTRTRRCWTTGPAASSRSAAALPAPAPSGSPRPSTARPACSRRRSWTPSRPRLATSGFLTCACRPAPSTMPTSSRTWHRPA